jgi:hypothetical protein
MIKRHYPRRIVISSQLSGRNPSKKKKWMSFFETDAKIIPEVFDELKSGSHNAYKEIEHVASAVYGSPLDENTLKAKLLQHIKIYYSNNSSPTAFSNHDELLCKIMKIEDLLDDKKAIEKLTVIKYNKLGTEYRSIPIYDTTIDEINSDIVLLYIALCSEESKEKGVLIITKPDELNRDRYYLFYSHVYGTGGKYISDEKYENVYLW